MDTRHLADRADALLARAAQARGRDQRADCLRLLGEAAALVAPSDLVELQHRIGWRIAKAGYDFDDPEAMLDGLQPLLEDGAPFAHVPAGRRALSAIADRWWDTRGYSDDRIHQLWVALAEAYRAEGDPWMESTACAKSAWHLACAGDEPGLDAIVERYLGTDPKRFGSGPHRHPRAPDTMTSVWWAQLELVRTGLWAAVWTRRRDRARDLIDGLLDAAEAADLDVEDDVWLVDPLCRAGLAFGIEDLVDDYADGWIESLASLDGSRASFHHALAVGLLAADQGQLGRAERSLTQAIEQADALGVGAEWSIDARLELARALGDTPRSEVLRAEAAELGQRFGITWAMGS